MKKSRMYTLMQSKRVLAIDPGFDRIGLAIMTEEAGKPILLFSECLRTSSKDEHSQRLLVVGEAIRKVVEDWEPEALAIEKLFFNTNTTSAIGVAEARGIIIYEAVRAGLEVSEYGPQAIKIAVTGYGKADKTQMADMVVRLVKMPARGEKRLDDEIDAVAVGITHLASQRTI